MTQRLSDSIVRGLPSPAVGNKITYDSELPGFGCRVTAAGTRAFVVNYRTTAGKERRITIGQYPAWSVKAAREEAKRLRRIVDAGGDPLGEEQAERSAPTVADLCAAYDREHLPDKRRSTQLNDRLMIRREILPRFGRRKVAEVKSSDIRAMHREISKDRTYTANRTLALAKRLFNFAAHPDRRWRYDNPAAKIGMNYEERRERYLSLDELQRLTAVLAEWPDRQAADIVRMLLLTGARKGEVLSARWDQFDFVAGKWIKPASSTKSKRTHEVLLSPAVLQLLDGIERTSEFVFPSGGKLGHRENIKAQWPKITAAARIGDLRIHDLRHSHASFLVNSGFSLEVIKAVLGHQSITTTQRYSHLYDETKKAAADRVAALVAPVARGEIVPPKGRA
jgi:integrase